MTNAELSKLLDRLASGEHDSNSNSERTANRGKARAADARSRILAGFAKLQGRMLGLVLRAEAKAEKATKAKG